MGAGGGGGGLGCGCCASELSSASRSRRVFFRRIAAASPAVTDGDSEEVPTMCPPGEPIAGAGEIGLCTETYG